MKKFLCCLCFLILPLTGCAPETVKQSSIVFNFEVTTENCEAFIEVHENFGKSRNYIVDTRQTSSRLGIYNLFLVGNGIQISGSNIPADPCYYQLALFRLRQGERQSDEMLRSLAADYTQAMEKSEFIRLEYYKEQFDID
ncbi:MAG: hypothetical protein MRY59_02325 [Aquisalinus sp.]|nr:hypothetical protein [Aquisalinus sp.]